MKRRIVSATLALCLALSLLPVNAFAANEIASGAYGANIYWKLDSEGVLTFSGSGEIEDPANSYPWSHYGIPVKTVKIGEGITSIPDNAFRSHDLSRVELPNSLLSIGDGAFYSCMNLAEIEIPPAVIAIGDQAFQYCYSLVSITIPSSVKELGNEVFSSCLKLESVVIEEGVETIGAAAFFDCPQLASVSIPSSVNTIGLSAFDQCSKLTSITVDKDNTIYTSLDGVVFTKNLKRLVAYPFGNARTAYTVPDGVAIIEGGAMGLCETLTSITIPASVQAIGFDALFMHSGTWSGARDIYYAGTKEQWEKILLLDDYFGGMTHYLGLTDIAVHYLGQYTVSYDANGGTGKMADTIASQFYPYQFPECGFTPPEGKIFKAWSVDGVEYAPNDSYSITADTTVYAQWTEKKNPDDPKDPDDTDDPSDTDDVHEVTFNANKGTFSNNSTEVILQTEKDGTIKSPPVPTRAGYNLDGWDLEKPGGSNLNDGYVFTADTTVYARWTEKPNSADPGDDGDFEPIDPVTVTFNANGGSGGTTMKTGTDGKLSALPTDPVRSGYTFDGWYFGAPDDDLKIYTSTVFRVNTTVYAHWTQNSSGSANPSNPSNPSTPSNPSDSGTPSGGTYLIGTPGSVSGGSYSVSHASAPAGTVVTIQVTPWSNYTLRQLSVTRTDTGRAVSVANYGGQYAFTMPASDVRLGISFNQTYTGGYVPTQPTAATRYVDWYYSGGSIYHATSGLVPAGSVLTRDMFIAVLYNLDGSGSGDPTIWAATNNIVPDVVMSELWGPDRSITREQAAMILYCYAQYKGYNTSRTMSLSGYRDAGQIRSMAVPAMAWCCATGLMTGTTASTLSPLGSLTCGQANTIISRFLSGVVR